MIITIFLIKFRNENELKKIDLNASSKINESNNEIVESRSTKKAHKTIKNKENLQADENLIFIKTNVRIYFFIFVIK